MARVSTACVWLASTLTGLVACAPSGNPGQDDEVAGFGGASTARPGATTGHHSSDPAVVANGATSAPVQGEDLAAAPADPIQPAETPVETGPAGSAGAPAAEEVQPNGLPWPTDDAGGAGGAGSTEDETSEEPSTPLGEPAHFIAIDSDIFRCGVKSDHTLWCWGQGNFSWATWEEAIYPQQVGASADWTSISVGGYGACGLRGQGTIECFGQEWIGGVWTQHDDLRAVGEPDQWQSLSTGSGASCAIKKDGTLWCFGSLKYLTADAVTGSDTPVQIGTDSDWASVSTNGFRGCAVKNDGNLYCWGYNSDGGVGDGTTVNQGAPVLVAASGPWLEVSASDQTCALRADHTVWCWGYRRPAATQVGADADWESIYGHDWESCGLRDGGKAYCFGVTNTGSGLVNTTVAIDESGGYVGMAQNCLLHEDGTAHCWAWGARGDGSNTIVDRPVRVGTDSDYAQMSLGGGSIGTLHEGGTIDPFRNPYPEGSGWREISNGGGAKCAIDENGALFCWGGYFGQNNEEYPYGGYVPVQIGTDTDWLHVATAGGGWMCGIRDTTGKGYGSLWCEDPFWGTAVSMVSGFADWKTIAAGAHHLCGIRSDGSLWCGQKQYQCGFPYYYLAFERVGTDSDWVSVTPGWGHDCAIKSNGSLWCRGTNYASQLGIGNHTATTNMVQVEPGTTWKAAAAGVASTCGVQTDGSLWCWGQNAYGELGVGLPGANRTRPARVGKANDWFAIDVSDYMEAVACGLRGAGELWCWGENNGGLVTHVLPDQGLVTVLDSPHEEPKFCAWPNDYDYDGYSTCRGDCDDANPDRNPYQSETCNGVDDDCDGEVDEGACN